jgi:Uma2 family endonuclease
MIVSIMSSIGADPVRIVTPRRYLPARMRLPVPLRDDELLAFCADNPDLRIEQTAQGELIILPPTGANTGKRNFQLTGKLFSWIEAHGTGVGFDSSTGFRLPNGATRSPDVAWVSGDRWDALGADEREGFAPICPDFVIELCSPSDDLQEQQAKLDEYIACGARLGWLIEPEERRVFVYRPDRPPEERHDPEELRGDPELPGFVIELKSIW